MEKCTLKLSLSELLFLPAAELDLQGSDGTVDQLPNPGDDANNSEDEDPDNEDSDDEDSEDDEDEEESPEVTGLKRRIESLEKEKERHYKRRTEAEARVTELEEELNRIRKDGASDDDLRNENTRLTQENQQLRTQFEASVVDNAFLADSTHKWKSPKAAMKLLNRSKIKVDSDGSVIGLDEAIELLAEEEPFLIEEEDSKTPPAPRKRSTTPPPGDRKRKTSTDSAARKTTLYQKYPSLRR